MVNCIKIKKLNLDELMGVINIYPWYSGARRELCSRMTAMGACSDSQYAEAALYMGSREILSDMINEGVDVDYTDSSIGQAVREGSEKRIIVVGGDYFSQNQYNEVRRKEDGIFSGFAAKGDGEEVEAIEIKDDDLGDFCTETLAQIYVEQEYYDKAKEIYSKLSLRYPEKSVYFAALIENLNKNK